MAVQEQKDLIKRTHRTRWEDGMDEIGIGLMAIVIGISSIWLGGYTAKNIGNITFIMLVMGLLMMAVDKFFRSRYSYPRLGYAKLRRMPLFPQMWYGAAVMALLYTFIFYRGEQNFQPWHNIAVIWAAQSFAIGVHLRVKKLLIHCTVTVMLLVLGASAEQYFLTVGFTFIVVGSAAFVSFIKSCPIITEED